MNRRVSNVVRRTAAWAGVGLLAVSSAVCRAQKKAQREPADDLPTAPSSLLQQKAKQFAAENSTAGSGAVFHPAAITPAPSGAPSGITVEQPTATPLALSLDDAISYAIERNVRLQYDRANQREVKGLTSTIFEDVIPNLSVYGAASAQELNLAAMGFKPSLISEFGSILNLPPSELAGFSTIVKVNTAQAQINASQTLFNLPDLELLRAAKSETAVINLNLLNNRGEVLNAVAVAYLKVLADQSNLNNAEAEQRAAKTVFDQATERLKTGVGTRLDALRGEVDFRQRVQATIAAQNALAEDTIQLNRIMGLPAGQQLDLTDTAPFAGLVGMNLADAEATAYARRKDYLSLQAQIDVANRELHAVKYQRLPTLAFNGDYGVLGQIGGLYHGVFQAEGSLSFPIFREAAQRGEERTISAQLLNLHDQLASLHADIQAQIRSAMLDVEAAHELVQVAQSNVDLAQQELSDERARFAAGVDTDLPVIDAEASVTGAQAQLVSALYQYNVAKLNLARYSGVIESRYRLYLNGK